MNWLTLGIVVILATAAQTSVAAWIQVHGACPWFLFIVAMFYGMHFPMVQAGLAGWVLGMAGDLTSQGPMGAQSLGLALAAMGASRLRDLVVVENPMVQIAAAAALCWVTYAAIITYDAWRSGWAGWTVGMSLTQAAWLAGYTALLTPYLFWLLKRASRPIGLPSPTRRR